MKKQTTTIAEISVNYNPSNADKPTIICSIDAYVLFLDFFPKETISLQESFVAMYLNRANRVIGIYLASTGGITGTVADVRLILSVALKTAATGIMLAHNHPSGSLKPSGADIELTNKIKEAAKFMDINVLDRMILSPEDGKYYSFADEGLM
jgi:DNA repair protein RadC